MQFRVLFDTKCKCAFTQIRTVDADTHSDAYKKAVVLRDSLRKQTGQSFYIAGITQQEVTQ